MRQTVFILLFSLTSMVSGQHQDKVDFIRAAVSIEPIPDDKAIVGLVSYQFKVLQDVDSIFLDAHQMEFSKVELNGRTVTYDYDQKRLSIKNRFKKGKEHTLELNYSCTPQQTVYFMGLDDNVKGNEEIWTQGQGKYTSHWVPSFDDMEEKVEFDLNITFDP
ncbi:MAG: M1 family peptidase, partial [Flavobacteriaceae bacterium]